MASRITKVALALLVPVSTTEVTWPSIEWKLAAATKDCSTACGASKCYKDEGHYPKSAEALQAVIDNYNKKAAKGKEVKCTAIKQEWKAATMLGQSAVESGVCWFDSRAAKAGDRCKLHVPSVAELGPKKQLFCPCTADKETYADFTRKGGLKTSYAKSGDLPSNVEITYFSLKLNQFTKDAYECLKSYNGAQQEGKVAARPEMLWTIKAQLQDTVGTWRSKVEFRPPQSSKEPLEARVWIYADAAEMMGIGTMLAPEKFRSFETKLLASYKELELCRVKVDKVTEFGDAPVLPAHVQPSGYWSPVVEYMDMPEVQRIDRGVSGSLMLKFAGVAGLILTVVGFVVVHAHRRRLVQNSDQAELVANGNTCDE